MLKEKDLMVDKKNQQIIVAWEDYLKKDYTPDVQKFFDFIIEGVEASSAKEEEKSTR